MKEETKNFLKEKKFVIGVPFVVKFKINRLNKYKNFKATKGVEVIKLSDVKKAFEIEENNKRISFIGKIPKKRLKKPVKVIFHIPK